MQRLVPMAFAPEPIRWFESEGRSGMASPGKGYRVSLYPSVCGGYGIKGDKGDTGPAGPPGPGLTPAGPWTPNNLGYPKGSLVTTSMGMYVAVQDIPPRGTEPSETTPEWQLLTTWDNIRGAKGDPGAVVPFTHYSFSHPQTTHMFLGNPGAWMQDPSWDMEMTVQVPRTGSSVQVTMAADIRSYSTAGEFLGIRWNQAFPPGNPFGSSVSVTNSGGIGTSGRTAGASRTWRFPNCTAGSYELAPESMFADTSVFPPPDNVPDATSVQEATLDVVIYPPESVIPTPG